MMRAVSGSVHARCPHPRHADVQHALRAKLNYFKEIFAMTSVGLTRHVSRPWCLLASTTDSDRRLVVRIPVSWKRNKTFGRAFQCKLHSYRTARALWPFEGVYQGSPNILSEGPIRHSATVRGPDILRQWFSTFHCLWPPFKDSQYLWPSAHQ